MEESGGQFVVIHGTIGKQELFAPNLDTKFKVLKSIYVVQQKIYSTNSYPSLSKLILSTKVSTN